MVKPGYKQTEIGVIPEDWDCREINSEIEEISMGPFGSDIPVSCFTSEGVPVLNGHSVSKVKLIDTFKNFVSEEKAKSLKKAVAQQGDIIVTHRGTIGQISYIPIGARYKKYVISQSQFRVRLNRDSINPHFVVSYFLSPKGQSFLLEKKGHTGVPALAQPTTNFRKLCIPLPSLPEQERIVNAFEDIDDFIILLEKQIAKKKAIKQGAMQELLTGKKRLPGFEFPWISKRIQDIAPLQRGFDLPYSELVEGQVPVVFSNGINAHHYVAMVKGPGVITGRSGTIGKIHYVDSDYWPHNTTLWVTNFKGNSPRFVYYLFHLVNWTDYMTGSGVPTLNRNDVHAKVLLIPEDVKEQEAIAGILLSMDSEIEALEQKLEKCRQVKQGMMQQLLTGKIRLV